MGTHEWLPMETRAGMSSSHSKRPTDSSEVGDREWVRGCGSERELSMGDYVRSLASCEMDQNECKEPLMGCRSVHRGRQTRRLTNPEVAQSEWVSVECGKLYCCGLQ
jgi:hypothetical protein